MGKIWLFAVTYMLMASSALANCQQEIQALFEGGAWDPFARENRREITIVKASDGSEKPSSDVKWDGPLKSINCTPNGCFMAIGYSFWAGTSFEGPWTQSGDIGTGDPEEFVRGTLERMANSISEHECLGKVELDGQLFTQYRFFSMPEPNEHGAWWGGRYSVWVDLEQNRLMRVELAEGIASWAPEPSADIQITTVSYDGNIKIEKP